MVEITDNAMSLLMLSGAGGSSGGASNPPGESGYTATHYVSATGTGTWLQAENSGTPCSLLTAMSNASAGDAVQVAPGVYSNNDGATGNFDAAFKAANPGTASEPVVFFAEYPAATNYGSTSLYSELRGTEGAACTVAGSEVDYVIFDGFYVDEAQQLPVTSQGLFFANGCDGCEFRRIAVDRANDTRSGENHDVFFIQSADGTVVSDCYTNQAAGQSSGDIQFATTYESINTVFQYNTLINTTGGFQLKGPASPSQGNHAIIRYNRIINGRQRAINLGVITETALTTQVHNNIVVSDNADYAAVYIRPLGSQSRTISITNNTFILDGNWTDAERGVVLFSERSFDLDNIICRDNIILGGSTNVTPLIEGNQMTGFSDLSDLDHNLYYDRAGSPTWLWNSATDSSFGAWQATAAAGVAGFEVNSEYENPTFTDEGSGDYTLVSNGQTALSMSSTGGEVGAWGGASVPSEIGVRANPTY